MISLDSLKNMKIFAGDPKQRDILLQDHTLIDGLVLLLSSDKEHSVIKLTLETFLLLAETPHGRDVLKRHDYLLIQMEETVRYDDIDIVNLAEKLLNLLKDNTFPKSENIYQTPKNQRSSYCQHSDQSSNSRQQKYKTLVFQLKGLLDKHDRELCTRLLVKIKGVVSIIFDMNRSRCTLRTLPKVLPETIADAIAKSQTMLAQQVVKNEFGEEVMVPFGKENLDGSYDGPDYLDEVESPQTDNQAMCLNDDSSIKSSSFGNWFHKATSFWTNGFW